MSKQEQKEIAAELIALPVVEKLETAALLLRRGDKRTARFLVDAAQRELTSEAIDARRGGKL